MVAYKAASVHRFLRSPAPDCGAALLYGPDAGLVAERAAALASHFMRRGEGQSELVRLDERDFAEDSGRLDVELRTIPMFAERKVVRVGPSAKLNVPALKALLGSPLEAVLVVEAGNLRPDSALRKLFEANRCAVALPCYGDERNVSALIDEELREAHLDMDSETRAYLMTRLGADQALSRSEVAKLMLFATGKGRVSHDDIDAIVGDSSAIAVETFAYDVSGGNAEQALRQLTRLAAAGTDVSAALAGLARHFTQLHRVAAALVKGETAEQALRSLRPRPHFKRQPAFVAHCRRWNVARLVAVMPMIQESIKRSRLYPDLQQSFAERLVLDLTQPMRLAGSRVAPGRGG
jgi:DNA polymerase-3 subunit delta